MADNEHLSDLLQKINDAHGGLDRFNRIRQIDMTTDVSGLMWAIKGYPGHRLVELTIEPFERRVIYRNVLGDGDYDTRWIWTPSKVWKQAADGKVIESRDSPRQAYDEHDLYTKWDHLHLLYFMGYAIWNYACAPFYLTWSGVEVKEIANPLDDPIGARWRVLEVSYDLNEIHSHCSVQKYYVDEKFVLRRLDYRAPLVSGSNAGESAHMLFDHQKFDGLLVPTLRRVVSIPDGLIAGGPALVLLSIHKVAVKDRE